MLFSIEVWIRRGGRIMFTYADRPAEPHPKGELD